MLNNEGLTINAKIIQSCKIAVGAYLHYFIYIGRIHISFLGRIHLGQGLFNPISERRSRK